MKVKKEMPSFFYLLQEFQVQLSRLPRFPRHRGSYILSFPYVLHQIHRQLLVFVNVSLRFGRFVLVTCRVSTIPAIFREAAF